MRSCFDRALRIRAKSMGQDEKIGRVPGESGTRPLNMMPIKTGE
jgi:hypothetical protein